MTRQGQIKGQTKHDTKALIKLLSSNIAVQSLAFLLLPLLGRLYTKADYGILGMLMSAVGVLTILANGRYDQATFVSHERGKGRFILLEALGLSINLSLTLITTLLCFVLPPFLVGTGYADTIPFLFIIPLTTFTSALFSMFAAQANVRGAYTRLSIAQGLQGIINNLSKVGLGFLSMGVWGFAIAFNFAQAIAISIISRPKHLLSSLKHITRHRLRVVAWYYRAFPMFTIGQATVEMMMGNLLIMFLPRFYEVDKIGMLTMLFMITRRPIQVFSDSISRVYGRRFVEAREKGQRFLPQMLRLLGVITLGAIVVQFIIPYFIEDMVAWVIGEQWRGLGKIIITMLPYLLMMSGVYIFNFVPDVLSKQKNFLFVQTTRFLFHLLIVLFVPAYFDFKGFLFFYYVLMATELFLLICWFAFLIHRSDKETSK